MKSGWVRETWQLLGLSKRNTESVAFVWVRPKYPHEHFIACCLILFCNNIMQLSETFCIDLICLVVVLLLLLLLKNLLRKAVTESKRSQWERKKSSICWFSAQQLQLPGTGPAWSQECGTSPKSPMEVVEFCLLQFSQMGIKELDQKQKWGFWTGIPLWECRQSLGLLCQKKKNRPLLFFFFLFLLGILLFLKLIRRIDLVLKQQRIKADVSQKYLNDFVTGGTERFLSVIVNMCAPCPQMPVTFFQLGVPPPGQQSTSTNQSVP